MNPKAYLFSFLLYICVGSVSAQIRIDCCGINQTIPSFKQDSAVSFYKNNVLVEKKILLPITASHYPLEIREYTINPLKEETVNIIKCNADSLIIESYRARWFSHQIILKTTLAKQLSASYKDYGNLGSDTAQIVYIAKLADSRVLQNEYSIAELRKLIKLHIYDLPGGDELTKIILQKFPNTEVNQTGNGNGYGILEIKLGKYVRNIKYTPKIYVPEPKILTQYNNLQEIYHTLSKLTKEVTNETNVRQN